MRKVSIIGLDLAKNVFQTHGAGADADGFSSRSCVRFLYDDDLRGWGDHRVNDDDGRDRLAALAQVEYAIGGVEQP